ncbi:MAG: hypothetical protein DRG78_13815 [Epsilonproteobacteria bacterium]|nr:MAG: hypothetical protein DRG78_13815 [Campylobacterota bacterium]
MKIASLLTTTLIAGALFITGCANKDMQTENHSGFLKNYDNLEENDNFKDARINVAKDADFTKYEYIYIEPVQVIHGASETKISAQEEELFKEISDYLTAGYKTAIQNGSGYKLAQTKDQANTLIFEGAISAVEVHFDDMVWYQFTPITLVLTGMARATYVDGAVRILGEGRFTDAQTNEVLMRAMLLQKGDEITTDADKLVFKDVKSALDTWLKRSNKNLATLKEGKVKFSDD